MPAVNCTPLGIPRASSNRAKTGREHAGAAAGAVPPAHRGAVVCDARPALADAALRPHLGQVDKATAAGEGVERGRNR